MKRGYTTLKAWRLYGAKLLSSMLLAILPGILFAQDVADWAAYGQTADVGSSATDVTVDATTYTVHTAKGLAWIAWVTNNKKISSTLRNAPAKVGFEECTIYMDKDIDLEDQTISMTDKSWIPIGGGGPINSSTKYPFKGTFNGNGHLIKGLTITSNAYKKAGLFGYIEEGNILNLGVELSATGIQMEEVGINVGIIAGFLRTSGSIENCYTSGTGKITITSNTGGTTYAGGIAGYCNNGCSIKNCYSTVDIKVTGVGGCSIGGIAGKVQSVTTCIATGTLEGKEVGGIAGSGSPTYCLAANPTIKCTTNYYRVGSGGKNDALSYATSKMQVYKDVLQTFNPSQNLAKHGNDCYTQTSLAFLGDAWDISDDNLPRLKIKGANSDTYSAWPESQPADKLSKSTYFDPASNWFQVFEAKVSKNDSQDLDVWLEEKDAGGNIYHVRSAIGLAWINYVVRTNWNSLYNPLFPEKDQFANDIVKLDNDIDLSADYNFEWFPLGNKGIPFKGTFDGDSHTISNMIITQWADKNEASDSEAHVGLFGDITFGQIKNLKVTGSITLDQNSLPSGSGSSSTFVGGIAGGFSAYSSGTPDGNISNCASSVKIKIDDDSRIYIVGGIIGKNNSSATLSKVYSTGDITVKGKSVNAGGITGDNRGALSDCYSTSNIDATGITQDYSTYAGGLIGFNGNKATLKNGFATGSVKGTNSSNAGGISGMISGTAKNCLALNKPSADGQAAISAKSSKRIGNLYSDSYPNYSSTTITLQENSGPIAVPTTDKGLKEKNGANVYRENYQAQLETVWKDSWTFSNTHLPQLKGMSGQPELITDNYLASAAALSLTLPNDGTTLSVSHKDGQWSYKDANKLDVPFNGTIEASATPTDNSLTVSVTDEPAPILTFQDVNLSPSANTPLTISEGSLTIEAKGDCSIISTTGANALDNKGTLAVTGEGTLSFSSSTAPVINNTGTLAGNWMEWQFVAAPTGVAITATDNSYTKEMTVAQKNFATILPAGKDYQLSKKTTDGNGKPILTRQQGTNNGAGFTLFQSPQGDGFTTFTEVKEAVAFTLTQPNDGGSISVSCNEQLLKTIDFLADNASIKLANDPLPGYEFDNYTVTGANASGDTYTVTGGATPVTITATFKKKVDTPVEEEPVKEVPPTSSVDKPTVVIPDEDKPAIDPSSTIKLIKSDLEEEHQNEVEEALKITATYDQLIYADIALVEVTTDGKMTPIQPKDGQPVTIYYPYPDGTDKTYTFTVVHLKSNGTTETFTVADGTLENTEIGLKFSVASFSPFGIAWETQSTPDTPGTPDDPDKPYPSTFYTVTIPAVKGVTTDPVAGDYEVESWSSFGFYLTLEPGYEQSVPVVTTDRGETIFPRSSDGKYIIKYVRQNIIVTINGIPSAVANMSLTAGTRIRTEKQTICITTDTATQVTIIDPNGRIKEVMEIPAGDTRHAISSGIYIIHINNSTAKIFVP